MRPYLSLVAQELVKRVPHLHCTRTIQEHAVTYAGAALLLIDKEGVFSEPFDRNTFNVWIVNFDIDIHVPISAVNALR